MWRRIFVVFAKEVIDNSRDRRSFLVALSYPFLVPLLRGLLIALRTVCGTEPEHGVLCHSQITEFLS